jgi:exodeoxyribonuclease VII large subunit
MVQVKRDRMTASAARMHPRQLGRDITRKRESLSALSQRFSLAGTAQIDRLRSRIEAADRLRETLSYKATLERGYAVVRSGGEVLTTKAAAAKAGALEIEFADGRMDLRGKTALKPSDRVAPDQGSLF